MRRLTIPTTLTSLALLLSAVPAVADEDDEVDVTEAEVSDEARDASIVPLNPEDFIEPMEEDVTEGDTTTVTIATDILFEFDEAEPSDDAQGAVQDLASDLDGVEGTVEIVGHTDGIGEDSYNQDLSERRAEAIRELLESELGADAPDFETEGRGADEPLADETASGGEDVPSARAKNRRVEVSFQNGS